MRVRLNDEEKRRYISRLLKVKRICLNANNAIEDTYKSAYECAKEVMNECSFNVAFKSLYTDLKSYIIERIWLNKIKKTIIEEGLFEEKQIALTVDDLIDMDGKANVLIGPIIYDESIPKHCLKNLVMVCSDADFRALDDSTCLTGLEIALGNLTLGKLTSSICLFFTAGKTDLSLVGDYKYLPIYQFAADDILVSHLSDDLNLIDVNGRVFVMSHDISLEPIKDVFKNKVTYFPTDEMYEDIRNNNFQLSYKLKRDNID